MDVPDVCVIIPVHKATPNHSEQLSLKQCKNILGSYSVFLVYPESLDISAYQVIFPHLRLQPVSDQWLSSIEGYNKMKRSLNFYYLFSEFTYMLTYELDSYIFSDDWNKANSFQYDYIGAPWFEGYGNKNGNEKIMGVGNSGFSLRNIQSCISVLETGEKVKKSWRLLTRLKLDKLFRFSLIFRLFNKKWNTKGSNYYFIPLFTNDHINEDIFWGSVVPRIFNFKVASILDSIKFSFEMFPSKLFVGNHFQLPVGCHAWEKYEPEFWKTYIETDS